MSRPPSYSLQVNIGGTGKVRDIRLECGYSAKELVDLLGYVSVFIHRVISGFERLNITKSSSTVTPVERDGLPPGEHHESSFAYLRPSRWPAWL